MSARAQVAPLVSNRVTSLLTVAVSLLGMVMLLLMTRWGIGTFPDSAHYIKGAHQLIAEILGGTPAAQPREVVLTQLAPFYSMLLAAGGVVGLDPMEGTRWLNAMLFGLNIFFVGVILRRSTQGSPVWITGPLLMLASIPVLSVHVSAMSEPLFLLLCLTGFHLLARYLESDGRGWIVAAGVAVGLAFLTRYAGAACIMTGAAALVLWGSKRFSRRLVDAMLFGIVSSLPMLAWMLRNVAVANTATGRDFVVHLVDRSHVWQALYTASSWLHIPASAPDAVRIAAWLFIGFGVATIVLRQIREGTAVPMVIRVLCLFIVAYGAFLAVSISFFDANTPLDDRILFPVFATGLIVLLYAVDGLWWALPARPLSHAILVAGLLAFLSSTILHSAGMVSNSYERGWGFTSLAWQQSATIQFVRDLPQGRTIYSNAPEIIYLNTGRAAKPIPKLWLPMNQQANPDFEAELHGVRRDLGASGVVVYFRGLQQAQRSMPSVEQLTERMSLRVLAEESDGEVLSVTEPLQH